MKGRGLDSRYIITRLFATDYFYYYSKPVLFVAYFFPFIAYGKNRVYLDSEFEIKIENIKNMKHGNFYNYATQGFGNIAFYEPYINFSYFYEKLSLYDVEKFCYFDIKNDVDSNFESDNMKKDIMYVLSKRDLLLKRGMPVLESVRYELINDLNNYNNKYVLAKMLYYIIDSSHNLPNVTCETQKLISETIGLTLNFIPNICFGFRKDMDENIDVLCERLKKASNIQMLCLDGISLFGDNSILRESNNFYAKLEEILLLNEKLYIEMVISKSGSLANSVASKYQVNIEHLHRSKDSLSKYTLNKILNLSKRLPIGQVCVKTTEMFFSYALFIVDFEDDKLNYIKLDIYSPFIMDNKERPCMYIFKRVNSDLYIHFKTVFENIWKKDECSQFPES